MADDREDVSRRLDALRRDYADELPGRLLDLEEDWRKLERGPWEAAAFEKFHRGVHALAGSGASFGFPAVSDRARSIDLLLRSLATGDKAPDRATLGLIRDGLVSLKQAIAPSPERASLVKEPTFMSQAPSRIAVVGAGTMGRGIAHVAALSGHRVALHDSFPAALEKARAQIEQDLEAGIRKGKVTEELRKRALDLLRLEPDLGAAARDADLVVEAVVEDLDKKRAVFASLDAAAPAGAVLATNTSSLSVAKIAGATARPDRVIGMHFFNPVHIMKLVEIVVHPGTADAARERVAETARRMGKTPIVVKDSPGFATSRLGVVLGLEAMRMLEQGVAAAEDIDRAMELGYNHPMGPLRLTDLVGLDVRLAIAEHLHRELKEDQYRPPEILRRKVKAGELGKKTKKGFYAWE